MFVRGVVTGPASSTPGRHPTQNRTRARPHLAAARPPPLVRHLGVKDPLHRHPHGDGWVAYLRLEDPPAVADHHRRPASSPEGVGDPCVDRCSHPRAPSPRRGVALVPGRPCLRSNSSTRRMRPVRPDRASARWVGVPQWLEPCVDERRATRRPPAWTVEVERVVVEGGLAGARPPGLTWLPAPAGHSRRRSGRPSRTRNLCQGLIIVEPVKRLRRPCAEGRPERFPCPVRHMSLLRGASRRPPSRRRLDSDDPVPSASRRELPTGAEVEGRRCRGRSPARRLRPLDVPFVPGTGRRSRRAEPRRSRPQAATRDPCEPHALSPAHRVTPGGSALSPPTATSM